MLCDLQVLAGLAASELISSVRLLPRSQLLMTGIHDLYNLTSQMYTSFNITRKAVNIFSVQICSFTVIPFLESGNKIYPHWNKILSSDFLSYPIFGANKYPILIQNYFLNSITLCQLHRNCLIPEAASAWTTNYLPSLPPDCSLPSFSLFINFSSCQLGWYYKTDQAASHHTKDNVRPSTRESSMAMLRLICILIYTVLVLAFLLFFF